MPRIRSLKPEFWSHPVLASQDDHVKLMAIALLNLADDEGYFLAAPALVRSFARPLDEDSRTTHGALTTLSEIGWIEVRKNATHGLIGRVVNFEKHQVINRPSPSRLKTYFAGNDSLNVHGVLTERSVPEQGSGNRDQGTGKKRRDASASARPTLEEVTEYCKQRNQGIDPQHWFDYYTANGWKIGRGNPMKDWRASVRYWETNGVNGNGSNSGGNSGQTEIIRAAANRVASESA